MKKTLWIIGGGLAGAVIYKYYGHEIKNTCKKMSDASLEIKNRTDVIYESAEEFLNTYPKMYADKIGAVITSLEKGYQAFKKEYDSYENMAGETRTEYVSGQEVVDLDATSPKEDEEDVEKKEPPRGHNDINPKIM